MVAWGLCCTLMGVVQSFPGLLVCRAALGIAEGGLFPGITYYITMWYRRHECGLRLAIFFSAATAAGAFGGLLARGINEMSGIAGLKVSYNLNWTAVRTIKLISDRVGHGFSSWKGSLPLSSLLLRIST